VFYESPHRVIETLEDCAAAPVTRAHGVGATFGGLGLEGAPPPQHDFSAREIAISGGACRQFA